MLELLSKDAAVGNKIKLYLISGEVFDGILEEIGPNCVLMDVAGSHKRFFDQMIGGWTVLDDSAKTPSRESMSQETSSQTLFDSFVNKLTEDELRLPVDANAHVKNVSKNAVFLVTSDNPNLGVPFSKIGDKRLISDLRQFHGEELPVYVQTFFDKKKLIEIPTIIILPGTVSDVVTLLQGSIKQTDNHLLSVNLCHILLKHIHNKDASKVLWNLVKELKHSKVEEKQNEQKATSSESSVAAMINRYATWGKTQEALDLIQKELDSDPNDLGYISSLLLRKAQLYSATNDYVHSQRAYEDLIQFQEQHKYGTPEGLSHYYTELARLLVKLKDEQAAIKAIENAIRINANNNAARNLLVQLTDEKDDLDNEETKDEQTIPSEIDRFLQADLASFAFTDVELLATNGASSLAVACRLLETAKQEQSASAYLEAAKAFYVLNVGSYSVQDLYDALYGYVRNKAISYYDSFFNALSGSFQLIELRSIIDSAICYFKEAIKIGPTSESQLYIWNSIRLSVSYTLLEELGDDGREMVYDNIREKSPEQLVEIIKESTHLEPSLAFIESIIDLCSDYPTLWNFLHNKGLVIPFVCSYIDTFDRKSRLLGKLFELEHNTELGLDLPSEVILSGLIKAKAERIRKHQKRAFRYLKRDVPLMVTDTGIKRYKKLVSTRYVVSPTEQQLFTDTTYVLNLLSTFYKRTETEQRTIAKSIIDNANGIAKTSINRPTFYSVTFFKPLLSLVIEAVSNINAIDSEEESPKVVVGTDTGIFQTIENKVTFDLAIENQGRITIDGFILTISFPGTTIRQVSITLKNRYISPGTAITIPVSIPKKAVNENILDITCCIDYYYLSSKHLEKIFQLTIIKSQETSLDYSSIKWEYGRTETRDEMFKGREGLLSSIREHFSTNDRVFTIVLFGLSRTGKSSILENYQLSSKNDLIVVDGVQKRIAPIFIDLADLLPKVKVTEHALKLEKFIAFTKALIQQCVIDLSKNSIIKLSGYPDIDFESFIEHLNEHGLYPVFMFDEFSYMKKCIDDCYLDSDFLHNLRTIAFKQSAGFIYSGTYDINTLIYAPKYNISASFVNITSYKIGKIEKGPAEELINAMKGTVSFSKSAIEQIHLLSGDIPYWIQVICKNCAGLVISTSNPAIGLKELDEVVSIIIGGISNQNVSKWVTSIPDQIFRQTQLLDSDPEKERNAILTGLAYLIEHKSDVKTGVTWSELNSLWQDKNYKPNKDFLKVALDNLLERDTLVPTSVGETVYYRFSVDIFRRWWGIRHRDIDKEFDLLSS